MMCEADDIDLCIYLKALGAVYRADQDGGGWSWINPTEPRRQSVQLVMVEGKPVAGDLQRFTAPHEAHGHTEVNVVFADSFGCSAGHVSLHGNLFHAIRIEYGLG